MKITNYLVEDRIIFGLESVNKEDVLKEMAGKILTNEGIIKEGMFEVFLEDLKKENLTSTGMQDGIAIPHAKSPAVSKLALVVAIVPEGIDFDAFDGEKSQIFFMIVASEETKKEHLDLLAKNFKNYQYEEDLLEEIQMQMIN